MWGGLAGLFTKKTLVQVAIVVFVVGPTLTHDLTAALDGHGLTQGGGGTSALNLAALPPRVQTVVRTVYGDATAHVFVISAAAALVGVVAVLLLRPVTLRGTVDLERAQRDQAVSSPARGERTGAPAGAGVRAGETHEHLPGTASPVRPPAADPGRAPTGRRGALTSGTGPQLLRFVHRSRGLLARISQ